MSDPIVVGLLGITHPHASARVRALREIDDVEVVAAADDDSRLKYFTDKYDLEPRTIDEILGDERINAIMVHSKSRDMVPHTVRALASGKSVVVEKPGGGTVDDLVALRDAEAAHGDLVVQVGYNVRLAESVSRAKQLIESGLIGEVVTVSARGAALAGEHVTQHLNQPADMGGGLWILGCHVLDALVRVFGAPESVNARVTSPPGSLMRQSRRLCLRAPELSRHVHHVQLRRARPPRMVREFADHRVRHRRDDRGRDPAAAAACVRRRRPRSIPSRVDRIDPSHFTPPFARTEVNRFSELPNWRTSAISHTEMRGWVDSIRTGAPIVSPVCDALTVAQIVDSCYRSDCSAAPSSRWARHDDGKRRRHDSSTDRHLLDQRR